MSVITFPDETPYLNPNILVLAFRAEVDGQLTLCEITFDALMYLGAAASIHDADIVAAFDQHKERIHRAARRVLPARTRLLADDFPPER